jgi:hypothetical protein
VVGGRLDLFHISKSERLEERLVHVQLLLGLGPGCRKLIFISGMLGGSGFSLGVGLLACSLLSSLLFLSVGEEPHFCAVDTEVLTALRGKSHIDDDRPLNQEVKSSVIEAS